MGLIRAFAESAGGILRDQWKEYFACEAMDNDTLIAKGTLYTKGVNKASKDIISNGSIITVNEGQAAIIVDDGRIVEFCAEPGSFKWDRSSEPSVFCGDFSQGLLDSFKRVGHRFTFGGDLGKIQRVYYINTKEILDNKFGTSTPMAYDDPYYRTVLYIRYFGQYSFKIVDPIVFYSEVAGNVADIYTKEDLRSMCTDEFMTALDTALSMCAADGIKFSQLPSKQREIASFMSVTLDEEWKERRGMEIRSVALNKVTPDDVSRKRIEDFDTNVMHSNHDAMAGGLAYAQMEAMKNAASNPNGSITGFMGLGMAANAMGGASAQGTLLDHASKKEDEKTSIKTSAGHIKCSKCGTIFDGKFCPECGERVAVAGSWKCSACGNECTGNFCSECGARRPNGYICECGYRSESPFKFCPECGKKA